MSKIIDLNALDYGSQEAVVQLQEAFKQISVAIARHARAATGDFDKAGVTPAVLLGVAPYAHMLCISTGAQFRENPERILEIADDMAANLEGQMAGIMSRMKSGEQLPEDVMMAFSRLYALKTSIGALGASVALSLMQGPVPGRADGIESDIRLVENAAPELLKALTITADFIEKSISAGDMEGAAGFLSSFLGETLYILGRQVILREADTQAANGAVEALIKTSTPSTEGTK